MKSESKKFMFKVFFICLSIISISSYCSSIEVDAGGVENDAEYLDTDILSSEIGYVDEFLFTKPFYYTEKVEIPKEKPEVVEQVQAKMFIQPCEGVVTQGFRAGHYGVDWANPKLGKGTPIHASSDGIILEARTGWNGGYGNKIIIEHKDDYKTLYGHFTSFIVVEGQEVKQGDIIGYMGNTGRVRGRTGIHLHFEIIKGKKKLNPIIELNKEYK